MIPVNDLLRAVQADRLAVDEAIARVLESGWFVGGPEVEAFEAEFAEFIGVDHCIGVGNGTDAIRLGLAALGIGPGCVVATVANAGFYASSAILQLGARPAYVDVRESDALMDPADLAAVLQEGVHAVILTHLYGNCAVVEQVLDLCAAAGVPLLEDCAQAAGAFLGAQLAGSFGDVSAFSFYPTKNLGALGDAGAVVTRSHDIAAKVQQLRQYGWSKRYVVEELGWNSRLDPVQAAVLRERLRGLKQRNARRRELVTGFQASAMRVGRRLLGEPIMAGHAWHLAVLVSPDRDGDRHRLAASGVASDVHYPVLDSRQPIFRGVQFKHLGTSEALSSSIFTIPLFPELTPNEARHIEFALESLGA